MFVQNVIHLCFNIFIPQIYKSATDRKYTGYLGQGRSPLNDIAIARFPSGPYGSGLYAINLSPVAYSGGIFFYQS